MLEKGEYCCIGWLAEAHHMQLKVVKLPEIKKGFVLLHEHWGVERSKAWAACFRRLCGMMNS